MAGGDLGRDAVEDYDSEIGPTAAGEIDREDWHAYRIRSWGKNERLLTAGRRGCDQIWDRRCALPEMKCTRQEWRPRGGGVGRCQNSGREMGMQVVDRQGEWERQAVAGNSHGVG
jgi:hypothetical protein